MPSNRPKLQGYVDSEIHKAFTDWKIEQGFEGDSQALTELLKQFFGFEKPAALGGMSKEDIQELIAEECEIGLREINARVEDHVQAWMAAKAGEWMEALGEAMSDRISQLEQKLQAVEDKLEVSSGAPSLLQEALQTVEQQRYVIASLSLSLRTQESEVLNAESPKDSQEITANLPGSLTQESDECLEEEPEEESECNPPFEEGDTFLWWDKEVRVERIGRSTLYCHYTAGGDSGNISYVRVPFEEAEKIKLAEHSELPDESSKLDTRSSQAISRRLQKADSLTQTELANRLNCHKSLVSRKKESLDFQEWTRERDPDAIAWSYDPKSKRYLVVR